MAQASAPQLAFRMRTDASAGPTAAITWQHGRSLRASAHHPSVQELFPTEQKQRQTLAFAQAELVTFLKTKVLASAADLGDPSKEGAEELETREARVATQALRALGLLVLRLPSSAASGVAVEEAVLAPLADSLDAVWSEEAVWERAFAAEQLGAPARDAAFRLTTELASQQPHMLERHLAAIAPRAFRALALLDASLQDSLWDMLLHIGQACPGAFRLPAVEAQLPMWLQARARTGVLGPAAAGALLPLLAQMLRSGPEAWRAEATACALLAALNDGVASATPDGRTETAAVFAEVLIFLARQREGVEEGGATSLARRVVPTVLPAGTAAAASGHSALIAEAVCHGATMT
jgi:hypothetical protein